MKNTLWLVKIFMWNVLLAIKRIHYILYSVNIIKSYLLYYLYVKKICIYALDEIIIYKII